MAMQGLCCKWWRHIGLQLKKNRIGVGADGAGIYHWWKNGGTGSGSDLIPPAPQPNCGLLNMENDEAANMFILCYLKKTGVYAKLFEGIV